MAAVPSDEEIKNFIEISRAVLQAVINMPTVSLNIIIVGLERFINNLLYKCNQVQDSTYLQKCRRTKLIGSTFLAHSAV